MNLNTELSGLLVENTNNFAHILFPVTYILIFTYLSFGSRVLTLKKKRSFESLIYFLDEPFTFYQELFTDRFAIGEFAAFQKSHTCILQ